MDEWIHEGLPPYNSEAYVWLDDGSVRHVKRYAEFAQSGIFFKDCTHPAQNAWCSPDKIKAWRLVDGRIAPPPSPDQIADNEACQLRARLMQQSDGPYVSDGLNQVWNALFG